MITSFSGTVISHNGSVLPGATLTLTNANNTYSALADAQGVFSFPSVPGDTYELRVSVPNHNIFNITYQLTPENNKQIIVLPDHLFMDDFESGLGNWTVQSPWAILNQTSNHVLTDSPTGNYSNNVLLEAVLNSPVSLQNISNPILTFDLKYNLEQNYDFLYVYGSSNGNTWTALTSYTGEATNWQTVTLSLSDYIGADFRLKFRLSSDSGITADGVYIDNVVISGLPTNHTVYGDTDANWMINVLDVHNVLEYSVGNDPIPSIDEYPWESFRLESADVDNDDQITATDSYYINNNVIQYFGSFPAQGGSAITFANPGLQLIGENGSLIVNAEHLENLKALTLLLPVFSRYRCF